MPTLQRNDEGTVIRITVKEGSTAVDISGATTMQMKFRKPSDVTVTKTPVFNTDGVDGIMKYVVEAGVMDEVGIWEVQPFVALNGWKGRGAVNTFEVERIL